jgi:hypothetical protein
MANRRVPGSPPPPPPPDDFADRITVVAPPSWRLSDAAIAALARLLLDIAARRAAATKAPAAGTDRAATGEQTEAGDEMRR